MLDNKIMGLNIFHENLNGERYLHFLETQIKNYLEELPIRYYNAVIWQQDGAPPHNVQQVTNFLNNRYNLWIGTEGGIR